MILFCPKLLSWCPSVNQVYTKLHLWRPFTKSLCPMSWRLSVPHCFCSTIASWSPVNFCSAEVVTPSTSSTLVVSISTHYIMGTLSFMGITIASLLHGPWSHTLLHSPDPPLLHSPSPLMLHRCSLVKLYNILPVKYIIWGVFLQRNRAHI